jgi:GNAT superfamily N-acetyltransferase
MRSVPRPLDPARDRAALLQLWEIALGATWPVHAEALMAATPLGYVFEAPDGLVGAIAFDESGAISYVIVDPSWRRQGIGRALHDAVVEHFRTPPQWHLGGQSSIWPGAPTNLPDAEPFFTKLGWAIGHTVVDMIMSAADFHLDPQILARASTAGVRFAYAKKGDAKEVIAYESREHPVWVPYFRARFPDDPGSVLLARDRGGAIVGALLIDLPPRHIGRWSRLLGDDMAEIGCVGIAAASNNQGIGTALVSEATQIVKKAGARIAFLAWTSRISFYSRLGYSVWREYRTATHPLT